MFRKRKEITVHYRGNEAKAYKKFRIDAGKMAKKGYRPVHEVFEPGRWGCGAFLLALLLCLVLIGILVFIYMLIVKPNGTLVVVYRLDDAKETAPSKPNKVCPRCAEEVKACARVCRFCGHDFTPRISGPGG